MRSSLSAGPTWRDQSGLSLIETMAALAVFLVVVGALFALLTGSLRSQDKSVHRALTTQEATAAAERLTRDIRNATAVSIVTAAKLDLRTAVRGAASTSTIRHVVWDCSLGQRCTRQEGPVGGALGGRIEDVVPGVVNGDVFTGTPGATDPPYVTIKLNISVSESQPVQFQNGVTVRQLSP